MRKSYAWSWFLPFQTESAKKSPIPLIAFSREIAGRGKIGKDEDRDPTFEIMGGQKLRVIPEMAMENGKTE